LKDSSKGIEVTTLRNFFRFQKLEGMLVHDSIFLLPLSPAVWKKSAFPKTMDEGVFDELCKVPNTNTSTGKRDYCIILFFTELALRCIEVATLTMDDFNWREGYVSIKKTKNHSNRKLPMSDKLYQAIVEYLKNSNMSRTSEASVIKYLLKLKN
jgi:site-specific recombinase XerD